MKNTKKDSCLRLEVDGFRERMINLLNDIDKNSELREEFVSNTVGVLCERVTGAEVTRHQVSEANRLMFAIIANDELVNWLDTYESEYKRLNKGQPINKEIFANEFAKKLSEVDDGTIISSLIINTAVGNGFPGFSHVAYQCVCNETTDKKSTTCTPVAKQTSKFGDGLIDPNTIRSLSEALINHAKELQKSGQLGNLNQMI